MKKIIALVAIVAMVAAFSISVVGKKLPSIGYVLVGPHTDGGWSMRHHQGFQSLTKHGYKVGMVEMVPEAESTKIFLKLARKHDIVFATSFGYTDGMAKAAEKSPDTFTILKIANPTIVANRAISFFILAPSIANC